MTKTKLIQILFWQLEFDDNDHLVFKVGINELADEIIKELEKEGKKVDLKEVIMGSVSHNN